MESEDTYSSTPELCRPESSRHESRSEFEEEHVEVTREDGYTLVHFAKRKRLLKFGVSLNKSEMNMVR